MNTYEYALMYKKMGLVPVPLKITFVDGKKSANFLVKWSTIDKMPSDDILKEWFSKDVDMAVITGEISGNLTLIDFDRDIYEQEWTVIKKYDLFKSGVRTKHGYHFMFRSNKSFTSATRIGDGIDIKSKNGISYMPPSKYTAGIETFQYSFISENFDIPYIENPMGLFYELGLKVKKDKKTVSEKVVSGDMVLTNEIYRTFKPLAIPGNLDKLFFSLAGYLARLKIPVDITKSAILNMQEKGDRNKTINTIERAYKFPDKSWGLPHILEVCSDVKAPENVIENIEMFDKRHRVNKIEIQTSENKVENVDVPDEYKKYFTADKIRLAQLELLDKLFKSKAKNIVLKAQTGVGKTYVYLAYARFLKKPTIVIMPDKAMQNQIENYNIFMIKGKSNYMCGKYPEQNAEESQCNLEAKHRCDITCPWSIARNKAKSILEKGGIIACNFANYRQYKTGSTLLIYDEFHKIIKEISKPITVPGGNVQKHYLALANEMNDYLDMMENGDISEEDYRSYLKVRNEFFTFEFIVENIENSYTYEKKGKTYVRLDEVGTFNKLLSLPNNQLFVSATPLTENGFFEVINSDISMSNRNNAPVVYIPLSNMSRASIGEDAFNRAAQFIAQLIESSGKIIVHTGNLEYADYLEKKLYNYGVVKHEAGKLDKAMEQFRKGGYNVLLTASGDSGFDFYGKEYHQQVILKMPYPSLNEEWRALEMKVGSDEMNMRYEKAAVDTIIQICGRISRGDDSGITYIIDSKFKDLYLNNYDMFSEIRHRLIDFTGELKERELCTMQASVDFGSYKKGDKFTTDIDTSLMLMQEDKAVIIA
jgi:tetratricopeptide (TPR) repeat protein